MVWVAITFSLQKGEVPGVAALFWSYPTCKSASPVSTTCWFPYLSIMHSLAGTQQCAADTACANHQCGSQLWFEATQNILAGPATGCGTNTVQTNVLFKIANACLQCQGCLPIVYKTHFAIHTVVNNVDAQHGHPRRRVAAIKTNREQAKVCGGGVTQCLRSGTGCYVGRSRLQLWKQGTQAPTLLQGSGLHKEHVMR